jgi:hypothetical protein
MSIAFGRRRLPLADVDCLPALCDHFLDQHITMLARLSVLQTPPEQLLSKFELKSKKDGVILQYSVEVVMLYT